jgi:sialate O-acetylesterase
VRVWFDHAEGLHSSGATVLGFEVAGADGHFVPATASVQGTSVVVSAPEVSEPAQVRYAWASFTDANLYNGVPLPASTFVAEVP